MTQDELLALIDRGSKVEKPIKLDLSKRDLTKIPKEIGKLTHLVYLDLSYNQICDVPEEISELPSLTTLKLSNNKIQQISSGIGDFLNLAILDLSDNFLKNIPSAINNLPNLNTLRLSNNQIQQILLQLINLPNLNNLDLSNNRIQKISFGLGDNLNNLTVLDLSGNEIEEIPDAIANLRNLKSLKFGDIMGGNKIKKIPDVISSLSNLVNLSFSGNQIESIPDTISNLSNLTTLDFSCNQIERIPDTIANLINLKTIDFYHNQIKEIPNALTKLYNLKKLNLSINQISQIPNSISSLTNLTQLSIFSNKISKIPEPLTNILSLTSVELSDNKIEEVPETISNLINLTRLHLNQNCITQFPIVVANLPNLTILELLHNPITNIPQEILKTENAEKILNYLRQLYNNRPLHEAKLLLIGQGSVGKTSLVERLIRNKYDQNQSQTDGLNVEPWNVEVNGKDILLNVWDFGGQEIYHATHQFFLTKRSLYLLVYDCRASEEQNRIEYWLKLIESFGGQSPVIIVGNKKDERPPDINRKALREKYSNIKAIIETSCQTNEGIEELRTTILAQVEDLKDVYDLIPLTWLEVKQKLELMSEDFITYQRYIGICHENKITEEQNQEQLIDLLHHLGLVLNFRDHPILKDTNVLKPNWVTEGIYALLSDEIIKTQTKGLFNFADLNRILSPERYPSERHKYLIELMNKFELCFKLDYESPQFLITGLLPKEEPDRTNLEGETLEFQYHYPVLPESIISRFIVITHDRIYNQTYWRSGVMLEYKESNEIYNIARIKADPEDKKIFIAISGRKETCRLFLGIIRDIFKRIHNTLPNLEITEWVPVPNYPKHDPLKYTELLGLEAMGETHKIIGELKLKLNLRQLLDGYEDIGIRQKQVKENDLEISEDSPYNISVKINDNRHSKTINQHGTGDNIARDKVEGDKIE